MSAIFGPAGNADSFPYKSSADAPRWLAELGLDAYEYQCGKGVNVREDTARKIGAAAREAGIRLSLHAPYFINLANPDPDSLQKTIGYITAACEAADWMGAGRVIIHSGALMKRTRREALDIAIPSLRAVVAACDEAGYGHIALCPETMGKINQLGDLDEVLELCTLDERLVPCVDFGHLYARSLGELEGHEACVRMLNRIREVLGEERAGTFQDPVHPQRGGEDAPDLCAGRLRPRPGPPHGRGGPPGLEPNLYLRVGRDSGGGCADHEAAVSGRSGARSGNPVSPAVWIALLAVFLLLFAGRRRARNLRRRDRRRRKESRVSMNEMIRQLLGKRCVVCLDGGFGGSLTGVLEAVEDNWLSVRTGKSGALELVNLDYVNRIQELPEKKK